MTDFWFGCFFVCLFVCFCYSFFFRPALCFISYSSVSTFLSFSHLHIKVSALLHTLGHVKSRWRATHFLKVEMRQRSISFCSLWNTPVGILNPIPVNIAQWCKSVKILTVNFESVEPRRWCVQKPTSNACFWATPANKLMQCKQNMQYFQTFFFFFLLFWYVLFFVNVILIKRICLIVT